MDLVKHLAEMILRSSKTIALTGAGISVESGIPDFRGAGGLWAKYNPMEFAHIDAFLRDPAKVWEMLLELDQLIHGARPNAAHRALAEMETRCRFGSVITQNVDNLHQQAGSSRVVEFHGNGNRLRCLACDAVLDRESLTFSKLPPRCACGGLIKPDVVFFGEPIPAYAFREAFAEAESCDLMLVVGTSAVVEPASLLPWTAKRVGASVVEVNLEETALTHSVADLSIQGRAGDLLPAVLQAMADLGKTI